MERQTLPSSTSASEAGSSPSERLMRVAPLDLRQQRFKTVLRGFDKMVESALGFPVRMADRPLTCVAEGAARCLADPDVVRAYEDAFLEAG